MAAPAASTATSRTPQTTSMPGGRNRPPFGAGRAKASDGGAARSADGPAPPPGAGDGCPIMIGNDAAEGLSKGLYCDGSQGARGQFGHMLNRLLPPVPSRAGGSGA